MTRYTATIQINGTDLLSYKGRSGLVLSPGTMPNGLAEDIASCAGLDATHGAAIGWNTPRVEQVSENVFRRTAEITVRAGKLVGHDNVSFVDTPTVSVLWIGTEDYSA